MSLLADIYWREPGWLLLAILPLLAIALARIHQRRSLHELADTKLLPWMLARPVGKITGLRRMRIMLAWLMLCVALAGPRTPAWVPPALKGPEQQVMALIDFSASMRVRDGHPDRISDAARILHRFAAQQTGSLEIGLALYAGQAHLLLPPSSDRQLFAHYLEQLPDMSPPTLGNNLSAALQLAQQAFSADSEQTLLVLTDGDLGPDSIAEVQTSVRQINPRIRIHWIGLGSDEHGTVPRANGDPLIIDGRRIISRRNAEWMQALSESAEFHYHAAESLDDNQLADLLGTVRPRVPDDASDQVLWSEHFGVPLMVAVVFLLLALHPRQKHGRLSLLALLGSLLTGLMLGGCQWPAPGDPDTAIAEALEREAYSEVRVLAAESEGYRVRYAEGIACYRLEDYACATQAFAQAAWQAEDNPSRGRAAFNLGLAHFRLGDFAQAAVLFRDAELHGVDPTICRLNRSFAETLAAGMRQWRADIIETERRAAWRRAAGQLPDNFEDRLADDVGLAKPPRQLSGLPPRLVEHLRSALSQNGNFQLGNSEAGRRGGGRSWVKSPQEGKPGNTAELMNALMTIESGLPQQPIEPLQVEGQRPW